LANLDMRFFLMKATPCSTVHTTNARSDCGIL
jgi:hypothetical protein